MKRGEITRNILEKLLESTIAVGSLFEALMKSGYGSSFGKIECNFNKLQKREQHEISKNIKRNYEKLIWKLKKDGFIENLSKNNKSLLKITAKGKERILSIKNKISFPDNYYQKKDGNSMIIIFDIPQKEGTKRFWLRGALKNLGFRMIQKSVWIGKVKIPEEFLDDLKILNLLKCVEIFEVRKVGTLGMEIPS